MAELSIRSKGFADFPERRLWAAIVADAINVCLGRTFVPITEQIAARRWILSPRLGVGGFLWCCHVLGLDETAVREQLARAARRSPVRHHPWTSERHHGEHHGDRRLQLRASAGS